MIVNCKSLYSRGRELLDRETEMALLMSATGSLALRKVVADIFSFATKHALLEIMHAFSPIYCQKNTWLSCNCA